MATKTWARWRTGWVSLLIMCVCPLRLPAQFVPVKATQLPDTLHWQFDKLTYRDGLPHNHVHCLHRDHQGALWFGTQGGLCQYDGVRVTTYTTASQENALPGDEVDAMVEQGNRWLWIATSGGLARYDFHTGRMQTMATPLHPLAATSGINTLFLDRRQGLWISDAHALIRYTVDSVGRLTRPERMDGLAKKLVNHLVEATDGTLWVACEEPILYALRPDAGGRRWRLEAMPMPDAGINHATDNILRCLHADGQGVLWMGTYANGLFRYDPATKQFQQVLFYTSPNRSDQMSRNKVRTLSEKRAANGDRLLYCGTFANGLLIYNITRHAFMPIQVQPGTSDGLLSNDIQQVLIDEAENVWLATEQGVQVYRPSAHTVQFIPLPIGRGTTTYAELVVDIADRAGRQARYLTGIDVGMWRHDARSGQMTQPPFCQKEPMVVSPTSDERGQWWTGTLTSFGRFYPETQRYEPLIHFGKNGSLHTHHRPVWVGDGCFLVTLNSRRAVLQTTTRPIRVAWLGDRLASVGHPINYGQRPVYDRKTGVWLTSDHSNLLVNVPDWRKPANYKSWPIQFGGQSAGHVMGLALDTLRRCLWISTTKGVFQCALTGRMLRHYGSGNRLADGQVFDAQVDYPNRLWLVGNRALLAMNIATGQVQNYGLQQGFRPCGPFQYISLGHEGRVYLSGVDGYQLLDSRQLGKNNREATVRLTDVKIDDNYVPANTVRESLAKPPVFGPDQNDLRVEFVASDGTYSRDYQYRYLLEGQDHHWQPSHDQTRAVYTNLSPGTYRFRVQAINSDGIWSRHEAAFGFTIEPPVWRRWWFVGLLVLTIGGLLYAAYRYQLGQVVARERLRQRIAHDLHDEIGSTLSSISLLSDLTRHHLNDQETGAAQRMVAKIHADARQMLEVIDEIIWTINPANDTLQRLVLRLQEYAQPLMEARRIRFSLKTDPGLYHRSLPMDVRQTLYFVTKEALNNLLKYASATEALVEIFQQQGQLQVRITDNGHGFDTTRTDNRTGRQSMQQRADSVGGHLQIDSAVGHGTRVNLTVPLR